MVTSDTFVSVVAPLRNDADIVEAFISEVSAVLARTYANYEIVLIDDGSTDETTNKVSALLPRVPCVRLITLSRNFGQEVAITAGLETVIGDYVVVMLPNDDPPDAIPDMVKKAQAGIGIIQGVSMDRSGEPWVIRLGTNLFYWYGRRFMDLRVPNNATNLRAMSRQAVNAVTLIKDRMRYLRGFSAYVGFKLQEYPYKPINRRGALRRRNLSETFGRAIDIIVSNSTHPLRVVSRLALVLSVFNLFYIGYVAITYFLSDHIAPGWVTQSMQIASMGFFVFMIMTVLCEYVGRILNEVQERPLYYVSDESSSPTLLFDEERKNVVSQ